MSGLDQPLVIANCNFHVGHQRSVRVAEELGYFKEEGLGDYVYQTGGLVPGDAEFDYLGDSMWERGVDIATAVDARAAIVQRARGADVYIVGGWRTQLETKLIGAKGISRPEQLRGVKAAGSGSRDSLGLLGISWALHRHGIDPAKDIDWVRAPSDRYASNPRVGDVLRTGAVSMLSIGGHPEAVAELVKEGYPIVLDTEEFYKPYYQGLGQWPPGKVIVATKQTIEQRGGQLRAFLRANVRAFWFVQNRENHQVIFELETRMRKEAFNEFERNVRMLKSEAPRAPRTGVRAFGMMVMDGLVPRKAVRDIIADLAEYGEIDHPIEVDDVLKDAAAIDAYEALAATGKLDRPAVEKWRAINT
jgi:ABC-type nitrate/sulfonate/bicarbonate transport system substrate-binding protein